MYIQADVKVGLHGELPCCLCISLLRLVRSHGAAPSLLLSAQNKNGSFLIERSHLFAIFKVRFIRSVNRVSQILFNLFGLSQVALQLGESLVAAEIGKL